MKKLLENIFFVGGFGCIGFLVLLVILGLTGIFHQVRDENGKFKKPFSPIAIFGFVLFIALMLAILFWGNHRLAQEIPGNVNLLLLFLNSFGIFMVLHLFDLIIIDYFIVVKWHPKIFNLPKTKYYTSIKPHVEGFYRGLIFGIIISILSATLSYFFLNIS